MVTKGQVVMGAVGAGGVTTFLTWAAWKTRLISLPAWLANALRVPQKNPTEAEKEADKTVAVLKTEEECKAHGFDWWAEKQACIYITQPRLGEVSTTWKGNADSYTWVLEKPYRANLVTYRFKTGLDLSPLFLLETVKLDIEYMGLDGKWHGLGQSDGVLHDQVSNDQSRAITDNVTKIRFTVPQAQQYGHSLKYVYATIL